MKSYIKTDRKIIKFDEIEIEKYKFHHHKSPILVNNIRINKIIVSNKISIDKNNVKDFIGYTKLDLYAFSFQK